MPPRPPAPAFDRTPILLDSSALLAFCFDEPGADLVAQAIAASADVRMTVTNIAECTSKLLRLGWEAEQVETLLRDLEIGVIREDAGLGILAGEVHARTRDRGLSIGDALCLAAALREHRPVLTADRAWHAVPLDIPIVVVR